MKSYEFLKLNIKHQINTEYILAWLYRSEKNALC